MTPAKSFDSSRLPILVVLFLASATILVKAIATPKLPKDRLASPFLAATLNQSASLPGWQLTQTTPLKNLEPDKADQVVGRSYEYRQGAQTLRVDLRPQYGDGGVARFLRIASEVKESSANLKPIYKPGVGHYGVLATTERLYLTACINSRGESTLTSQQFQKNRYSQDLQPGRILPWVLGQKSSFFDERCLWALMSVPLPSNSERNPEQVQAAYATLESAWVPLQQWWQANFPTEE